jgi:hypothetical protein
MLSRLEVVHNSLRKLLQALPFQNRFTVAQSVFDIRNSLRFMKIELQEGVRAASIRTQTILDLQNTSCLQFPSDVCCTRMPVCIGEKA